MEGPRGVPWGGRIFSPYRASFVTLLALKSKIMRLFAPLFSLNLVYFVPRCLSMVVILNRLVTEILISKIYIKSLTTIIFITREFTSAPNVDLLSFFLINENFVLFGVFISMIIYLIT